MRLPPRAGQLFVFNPSMPDLVDPDNEAVKGQVVRVIDPRGHNAVIIGTPDGRRELGTVSESSLCPLPVKGKHKIRFDQYTGMTDEAKKNLA